MGGAERQITMANEGGAAEKWDWRRDMKVALAFFGAVKRYVFPLLATVPLRGGRCSSTLWTLRSPTCAPSVVVRRRRSAPFPHADGTWPLLSAAALAAHGQLLSTALERPPSTALCAEWLSRGGRCSDANLRFSCMATCAQAERRRLLSAAAAISHVLTPPVGELPTGRHGDSRAKSSACPD